MTLVGPDGKDFFSGKSIGLELSGRTTNSSGPDRQIFGPLDDHFSKNIGDTVSKTIESTASKVPKILINSIGD